MAQTGLNRASAPSYSAPPPPRPMEIKGDPEKVGRTVHIQNLEPHVRPGPPHEEEESKCLVVRSPLSRRAVRSSRDALGA